MSHPVSPSNAHDAEGDQLFRLLVENIIDYAIYLLDPNGNIRTWNKAAERFKGYSAEEIIGQNFSMFFTDADRKAGLPAKLLEEATRVGRTEAIGNRVRKDGSTFRAHIVLNAIRDESGELIGFGKITRDFAQQCEMLIRDTSQDLGNRMQAIVETVPDAVITINAKGIIESFNPAAHKMFGYAASEVIGKNIKVIMPQPYHDEHDSYLSNYMETGDAKIIGIGREVTAVKEDGTEFPIELAVGEFEVGEEKFFAGVIRDMSERKRAEREQLDASERIRAILETVPDGIITIDEDACVETFNPAAEKLFGFSAAEVIGQNVKMLMPEPYHSEHDGYLHAYHDTGDAKIIGTGREVMARRKNGSVFPIELAVGEIALGDRLMYAGVVRDITERKLAEDSMRYLNEALEKRVTERTEAVKELQQAMRQLQDAQDQLVQTEKLASLGGLVAGIAHEINTPVGIGVTAASHLQEITESISASFASAQMKKSDLTEYLDSSRQSTDIILNNLRRAAELINSFKQVAVDQSSSEQRRFNLLQYIEEVLTSLRPQLRKSRLQLELSCPEDLELDTFPGALAQIITNLVINATMHAFGKNEEGSIHIDVEQQQESVVLIFRDNGKGISREQLDKIFDPFYTTRRGQGGSGLGLNIVYNLATQQLRGTLNVDSELGKGTVFRLSIPR